MCCVGKGTNIASCRAEYNRAISMQCSNEPLKPQQCHMPPGGLQLHTHTLTHLGKKAVCLLLLRINVQSRCSNKNHYLYMSITPRKQYLFEYNYTLIDQNVQKFPIFASYIASILNMGLLKRFPFKTPTTLFPIQSVQAATLQPESI